MGNEKKLRPVQIFNRSGWFLFMLFIIMTIAQVIITIPVTLLKPEIASDNTFLIILSAVTYYVIAFPCFVLAMRTVPDSPKREKKKLSVFQFFGWFFISFAVINIANLVNVAFAAVYELVFHTEYVDTLNQIMTKADLPTLIVTVFLAPIFEELTFRYFLLNKIRKYGDKAAILTTGLLFGLFHMNYSQFIYATALGFVFAYVVLKTNRIRYSIGLHMLVNFFGGTAGMYVEQSGSKLLNIVFYVLYFAMIIAGIVYFAFTIEKVHLEAGEETMERPFCEAGLNPGILTFSVICFIMMHATLAMQILTQMMKSGGMI